MRSCLIQLLIAGAVIFALLWFGLPFGASWLATNALNAAGFNGTDTKVEVSAAFPPRIIIGHADKIRVTSSQVSVDDLHAATIDVSLNDVELINRTFGTVDGTLTGVRVPAPTGDAVTIDKVAVEGVSTAATATMTISQVEAERVAEAQLKGGSVVKFAAPNKVTMTLNGKTEPGHLAVKDGSLIVVPDSSALPGVTIIAGGRGNPFHLTSVTVGGDTITLVGTIDVQSLLGV
jgi:hypothetical protein